MVVSVPCRLKGLVAELSRHCLHVGWPTAWRLPSTTFQLPLSPPQKFFQFTHYHTVTQFAPAH